ncbi:hypothetical protein AYL99_00111 [Fonsecaea erecta]|uniref:U3 small nucleolar RNA-associated protein 10 n=1 Tax=Fonsecaea erecta TaxID=1367422 RepID=A0A178ZWF5_9EURO|nr:hypothetical protein AYL99_00111 [Fonsecaea erecta]OAP64139.1 hypothetical protein AYL99_00111 [Fonsecaea erecta]
MSSSHHHNSQYRNIPRGISRPLARLDARHQSVGLHSHGPEVRESSLFVEDGKGDRQNLTYGSLDRRAIPRYRPAGHGGLLGLGPNYRIVSRSESQLEVENVEYDSIRRSRRQSLLENLSDDDGAVESVLSGVSNESDLREDFLSVDYGHPRKRRRMLAGREQATVEDDDSEESDPDGPALAQSKDAFDEFKQNPIHQRHIELLRATEARPEDASAWLTLIEYQPILLGEDGGSRSSASFSSRTVVDLKISLYEEALSRVKGQEARNSLILGLMKEGRKIWDADKQASKWRTFLNEDASFDLWRLYLNFVQTNHVKFSFESCLGIYKQWLQRANNSSSDRARDTSCIYILLRLTLFLWQSGFTERAVGIWQALLEFNYFRPRNTPSTDLIPSFEQFWASEVARIGEEGSAGWRSNTSSELEVRSDKAFQVQHMDFEAWAAAEDDLERTAGLPARALDDVCEDDPYRVLLFSDIQDFLLSPITEEGTWLMQDAFLLFAGLSPLSSLPESRAWQRDPFVHSQSPACGISVGHAGREESNFGLQMRFQDVFLVSRQLNDDAHGILLSSPSRLISSSLSFVRRVLSLLVGLDSDEEPGELHMEYAIALEAGVDLKSARKQTRKFLKHKADSLKLYNTYGLLECHLDNLEGAEKVWSTALSMRYSLSQEVQIDSFLLWRDWAYSYMRRRHFHHARALLCLMTEEQVDLIRLRKTIESTIESSAATQLKTEQYIKTHIDQARSQNRPEQLPALVDVLVVHRYLNADLSLEVALQTYHAALRSFAGLSTIPSAVLEAVHEQQARFIHAHAVTFGRSFRPRELVPVLKESKERFPNNLNLLLLHHYFLQKAGLFDRLRQVDSKADSHRDVQLDQSVVPSVFELMLELNRPSYSGSTDHTIRSAFERVTQPGSPGHDSLQIWKTYVLWETSLTQFHGHLKLGGKRSTRREEAVYRQATTAIQSFYAALRACPWSKELCMLGFTQPVLRDAIGNAKLKQVYQTMLDRGMRVHLDISDTLLDQALKIVRIFLQLVACALVAHGSDFGLFKPLPTPAAMTSTFAAQLRTIAANSTSELDLRARRDAHGESLIFARTVAVKQDWETIYQVCVEGYQELCLLDARLHEFGQNLFSAQSKSQDREQLSKTQNEALGLVLDRCLTLLGSKVALRPGLKAVEWLVRRFRVHVYNTDALLATFLPYHETPVFRNILSIIPTDRLATRWKFLAAYHREPAIVPRHVVVYTATHNDAFFSFFNDYTLHACQEGAAHSQLLRFWGSFVVEAITGRLSQVRNGRKEVQKQQTEDALLKILPLLNEGFEIKDNPEFTVTCFTITLVLAGGADLGDHVIDSLMKSIAPFIADEASDSRSALACLAILVTKKTDMRVPRDVLDIFMNASDPGRRMSELLQLVPLAALFVAIISSALSGLKEKNMDRRLQFIERMFDAAQDHFTSATKSQLLATLLRKLSSTDSTLSPGSICWTRLVRLLQSLADSSKFSSSFPQAVFLAGLSQSEVEDLVQQTIQYSDRPLLEQTRMEVDPAVDESTHNSKEAEAMLESLPSETEISSFLTVGNRSLLFDQLVRTFAVCHKNNQLLERFEQIPLWHKQKGGLSVLHLSFMLRVALGPFPVAHRNTALQLLLDVIKKGSPNQLESLIPFITVLLSDNSQHVRRAAVACTVAIHKAASKEENGEAHPAQTLYDALGIRNVKPLVSTQAVKILDQAYLPYLEECMLDPSYIRTILQTAFDKHDRTPLLKANDVELKKNTKHALYDLLTGCALGCALLRVKIGILELLGDVHKVGASTTSKILSPILEAWASLEESDAVDAASSEGLPLDQIDAVMVRFANPRDKDAVEHILGWLVEDKVQPRNALVNAFFDRIAVIWKDMHNESQTFTALRLFDMSFSKNPAYAAGSRHVLHMVNLSTKVLAVILDHSFSGLAEMQTDVPPRKRRRVSHGRESIPKDLAIELDISESRLTFALELVEDSKPQSHPQLLGGLFEVLIILRRLKDKGTSESPYLLHLCLSSILAIIENAQTSPRPTIDFSSIRTDLVTDCVRSSENPQVQSTALLLSSALASLAPDRILHSIMPIFTFMGKSILSKDDERSIFVTNRAIDEIIPPLVATLKKQDAKKLIHSTSSLLSSFVTAYDHVPQYRRAAFYQRLLSRLGADDFAFAVIALLASRRHPEDMSSFFASLMADLSAPTQLMTFRKLIDLSIDIFSDDPHDAAPLLDISGTSSNKKREQEALILLEVASKLLEPKSLKTQVKRLSKTDDAENKAFWAEFEACMTRILSMLKSQKAVHANLTPSTRKCLSSLLDLPFLADLLKIMPNLLHDMVQPGEGQQELQPLALRVLATQLQHNAPSSRDARTQAEAMTFLPNLQHIIRTTDDEAFRHAAIACLDRIIEVYGRKKPEEAISASSALIEGNLGLESHNERTRIMSLLCLASTTEVLKGGSVRIVVQALPKVLRLLDSFLTEDSAGEGRVELHDACFALLSSFITHTPYMIGDESVADILSLSYRSCLAGPDAGSRREARLEMLSLMAQRMDLKTVVSSLNQAWKSTVVSGGKIEGDAIAEYLDMLSQAIERNSKSTVVGAADEISAFVLEVMDLRRLSRIKDGAGAATVAGIENVEKKLHELGIVFIYKLNDTTFRPIFEGWVDWATKRSPEACSSAGASVQMARQTSFYLFATHFFATLKSIVTSYARYLLPSVNDILRAAAHNVSSPVPGMKVDSIDRNADAKPSLHVDLSEDSGLQLYKSTLTLLTTIETHDADGFFTSPMHFQPLTDLLVSQLGLLASSPQSRFNATPKTKAKAKGQATAASLHTVVFDMVIPCIVALANSVQDVPTHHHALNHLLCQLRRSPWAAVRLASIRTQVALTESPDVGDEWLQNVVLGGGSGGGQSSNGAGAAAEGGGGVAVGGAGETMIYVYEMLEDDDEEVEEAVRDWVRMARDRVGEDVFEF